MSVFSSLTNRIFIASALLVVASIAVPVYFVIGAMTEQAEAQLRGSLDEAASLVDEYGRAKFEDFVRLARLVADLPRLKAAVAEDDPPTVWELGHASATDVDHGIEVRAPRSLPLVVAHIGQGRIVGGPDAVIDDEDVQPAEGLHGVVDRSLRRTGVT